MATNLYSLLETPDILLELEPEELAQVLLTHFNLEPDKKRPRQGFILELPGQKRWEIDNPVQSAILEAWSWLERQGLIAHAAEPPGLYFVTRRGQQIKTAEDFEQYEKASLLPKQLLHPAIRKEVLSAFLRGHYDTAVFEAFREVEIAVRAKGNYGADKLGVSLMREAFNVSTGPLTDPNAEAGEKQALSDLFAGAIGSYKNPTSHRHVPVDAPEAVEMIMLASHLLKIVDSRPPST